MIEKKSKDPQWQELKSFLQSGNLKNWESYKMVSDFDHRNIKNKETEREQ